MKWHRWSLLHGIVTYIHYSDLFTHMWAEKMCYPDNYTCLWVRAIECNMTLVWVAWHHYRSLKYTSEIMQRNSHYNLMGTHHIKLLNWYLTSIHPAVLWQTEKYRYGQSDTTQFLIISSVSATCFSRGSHHQTFKIQ